MFPPSIYDLPEEAYPEVPTWRTMTWLPTLDRLASLEHASQTFEYAGLRAWRVAARLVLWDDERSQGWHDFADQTCCELISHFQKSGDIRKTSLLASHLSGGLDSLDSKLVNYLQYYRQEVIPLFAKFYWEGG